MSALFFLLNSSPVAAKNKSLPSTSDEQMLIQRIDKPFKGDLDQIRARRIVRVLVNYSRTNFIIDRGKFHGFEYELLKAYEKHLNKEEKNKYAKTKMLFVPVPFDQILQALNKGRGDIAAAGLTITPDRQKIVAFTKPYIPEVDEIVVLNKKIEDVETVEDLSNRMVYVRKGSSYVKHLKSLNEKLKKLKRPPVKIIAVEEYIVTEDILEFVNAGVVDITVADHHIAQAWSQVLPDIVIRKDLKIISEGKIAWAVRKDNRELLSDLNAFIRKNKKGSLLGNILFKRYYQNSKLIHNPITEKERDKLNKLIGFFEEYGLLYDFKFLKLAAVGYQESGLDNSKRSPTGAIGIMQVLPSTASDKHINIKNIHLVQNNIHAGTKYLNFLRTRYFSASEIIPADRVYFSLAAYNAGPAKLNKIRRTASERGFDPNKWFFNVEYIAAEVIGKETVNYVANINKYYVAYQLYYDMSLQREKTKASFRRNKNGK
jgi:membrane-bound lytic murein transglycosylase MltF